MAAIQPVLVLSGDVSGTLVGVTKMSITWSVGAVESMSYTLNGDQVSKVTPGIAPTGTRKLGFSFDGGASIDGRMLSTGTQVEVDLPVVASETGQSIGQVLSTSYTHRLTAQQVRLDDVFNGVKGSVVTSSQRILTPGNILPNFAGVAFIPTVFAFFYTLGAAIASIVLDIDSNRDKISDIIQAVCERIGSYINPQLAQWYFDSGDLGVAGGPGVVIGEKGTSNHLTFITPVDGTSRQTIEPGSQVQPSTLQETFACSIKGGSTNHGLPDGAQITDLLTVNHNPGDGTGNYRSGMPVMATYGDRNNGGVSCWIGDGAWHPMSQAMGVHSLWYDDSLSLIYAATEAGIYQHSPNPEDPPIWARLGGMALPCAKVISSYGRVYALVTFPNSGIAHVLMYSGPGTGLPEPAKGYGYDDWQSVFSLSGLTDFGIITTVISGGTTTTLYALSSGSTGKVVKQILELPGGATPPKASLLDLGGTVGIGLDCVIAYANAVNGPFTVRQAVITDIYVRTDGGSANLFRLGTGAATPVSTAGMTDANDNTVQINQIYQHSPGVIAWDGMSTPIQFLAATSAGIFASADGVHWRATDGQSNLGDVNVTRVASAPPVTFLGEVQTGIYGTDGSAFYASRDGLLHSEQMLTRNLDAGPAFFAAFKKNTGSYPDNTDTTMKYPDWHAGPYTVRRGTDGIGLPTFTMENPTSTAPADAARFDEQSNVSTPSQVAEIPNSTLLLDGMARFLAYTSAPQGIFQINSWFEDTADPLRTLRPTYQVGIDGTIASLIIGVSDTPIVFVDINAVVWVLEHTINYDADEDPTTATTVTKCAYLLLDDRSDPAKVDSDLAQRISRIQLYNNGNH